VAAYGYSAIRSDKKQAAQSLISMPFSVMAGLCPGHDEAQAFFQAFPNLSLISPSSSKDSFGGFAKFQGLATESKPKRSFSKFFTSPWARRALRVRPNLSGSLKGQGSTIA
jgi:hypothetical protein